MTKGKVAPHLTVVILTTLALSLPFASKAFYFDDAIYIEIARQQTGFNPLDTSGQYFYNNAEFDNLALNAHPIVIPYTLRILMNVAGGAKEVPLHLGFALYAVLASVSAYFVATRFTAHPLLCTLAFITTPAFVISSHSLMSDVPQVAFWLASVAFAIRGIDDRRTGCLVAAGLMATLAAFTGYQTLSVIPLILLYGLLSGGRRGLVRAGLAMSIPVLLFTAWSVGSYYSQGIVPLFHSTKVSTYFPATFPRASLALDKHSIPRVVSMFSHLGGVGLFPVLIVAALLRRRFGLAALIAGPAIASILIWLGPIKVTTLKGIPDYPLLSLIFLWLCLALGSGLLFRVGIGAIALLYRAARREDYDRPMLFLSLWVVGVAVYCTFLLPFAAARYLLPMLLPLSLIVFRILERRCAAHPQCLKALAIVSFSLSAVLSVLLGVGDYEQAEVYREFTRSERFREWLSPKAGQSIYVSAELSPRFYALEQGGSYLAEYRYGPDGKRTDNPSPQPKKGDLIFWCKKTWGPKGSRALQARVLKSPPHRRYAADGSWPLRTHSKVAHAGFYTQDAGFLPFWIDTGKPLEIFGMYRVVDAPAPEE